MTTKGARHFLFLSRKGMNADGAKEFVMEMSSVGAQIEAPVCDITDATALQQALDSVKGRMPPIRGCIQAAMVINVRFTPLLRPV
jgi:hypothetical protein